MDSLNFQGGVPILDYNEPISSSKMSKRGIDKYIDQYRGYFSLHTKAICLNCRDTL